MNADERRFDAITEQVIGCAFKVSNTLGTGFLEKVYQNALAYELRKSGLTVQQKFPIPVKYDGIIVGDYEADLLVEQTVLIELKAVKQLGEVEMAQCMNYLRATGLKLCLLINFGTPRVGIKRIVNDL